MIIMSDGLDKREGWVQSRADRTVAVYFHCTETFGLFENKIPYWQRLK